MSLNKRLLTSYLLPVIGIVLVGIIGVSSNRATEHQSLLIFNQTLPLIQSLEDLRFAALRIVSSSNEFAFLKQLKGESGSQETGEKQLIDEGVQFYTTTLQNYKTLVNEYFPDKVPTLDAIVLSGQDLQSKSNILIGLLNSIASDEDLLAAKENLEESERGFLDIIDQSIAQEIDELAARQNGMGNAISATTLTIEGTILATLIIITVVGILILRSIVKPIQNLMRATQQIEKGDFEIRIAPTAHDEIGQLGQTFVAMALSVRQREQSLQELTQTLEQRIQERVAKLLEQEREIATANERQRLARDLHDSVSQNLFAASLIAESLPKRKETDVAKFRDSLLELARLTRGAQAQMRTLLIELRPDAVVKNDLRTLMQYLIEAAQSTVDTAIELKMDAEPVLPPDTKVAFYRIIQECLNNVIKHAKAKHMSISIEGRGDFVQMIVEDDGRGFDMAGVPSDHFGLKIIRERAYEIGAPIDIRSGIGQGTQVKVMWPRLAG